ncbi:Uncharacterised protein [BD1-7 clade bacterium]|uniref:Alginate export domain-containing protein n=1 Tax=BD1-7 clade bacterium TaxID=2029982 RepID=A0A5S9P3J9_9GAMM|nr:Uncharacterised protein [BD1-7 clade bacterium]CAA0098124.1 Uncharacterised protein [BD1-7 clade bacterium]
MKFPKSTCAVGLAVGSLALLGSQPASAADDFYEWISSGEVKFDTRFRWESVKQSDAKKANGLTLRTRLGYKTAEYATLSGFIEFSDNRIVGGVGEFSPNETGFPTIADRKQTVLNQAYLRSEPLEGMTVTGGRQRFTIDNQRFIGNYGWRQTERTFDAITFTYNIYSFDITLGWIDRVQNFDPVLSGKSTDYLANLSFDAFNIGKFSLYYYDLDNRDNSNFSDNQYFNKTYGFRFHGTSEVNDYFSLIYTAEYARQDVSEYEGASVDVAANYYVGEIGVDIGVVDILVGYEVLGSDQGGYGFQTPLGSNHAFNGWADVFEFTPDDGLQDLYVQGFIGAEGLRLGLIFHEFKADEGGRKYGTEFDIVAQKTFARKYTIAVKWADFGVDSASTKDLKSTSKLWVWGEMKF